MQILDFNRHILRSPVWPSCLFPGWSCAAHRSGISDPGRVVGLLACLFGLLNGEDVEQLERHDFDEKTCTVGDTSGSRSMTDTLCQIESTPTIAVLDTCGIWLLKAASVSHVRCSLIV